MKENPHEKCMVIGRTQQILANILHIFIRIGAGLMRTMGGGGRISLWLSERQLHYPTAEAATFDLTGPGTRYRG